MLFIILYYASLLFTAWLPAYIISTITPRSPVAGPDASPVDRVIICEQNNDIRSRNNIVRMLEYIAFDIPAIVVDLGTARPYLPYHEDCSEGGSTDEKQRIMNSAAYNEWIFMRNIEQGKFLKNISSL